MYISACSIWQGGLVGFAFAIVTLLVSADIFNKQSAFWKIYKCRPEEECDKCRHTASQKLVNQKGKTLTVLVCVFFFSFSSVMLTCLGGILYNPVNQCSGSLIRY
jgi:hypothetical protein